jgi:hypothetical protein
MGFLPGRQIKKAPEIGRGKYPERRRKARCGCEL